MNVRHNYVDYSKAIMTMLQEH